MRKIGVLVSGRGSNLQAIMDRIADGYLPLEIAVVISDKSDAFALERAQKAGIKTVAVERKACASKDEFEAKITAALEENGCELVVLAGFMRVLGAEFCDNVKAINLHPSILPLFKGAHAIKESFESNMQVGGITVHWVSSELDGGKIIAQKTFARKNRTFKQWEEKIHKLEHKLLPKTIISLLKD